MTHIIFLVVFAWLDLPRLWPDFMGARPLPRLRRRLCCPVNRLKMGEPRGQYSPLEPNKYVRVQRAAHLRLGSDGR